MTTLVPSAQQSPNQWFPGQWNSGWQVWPFGPLLFADLPNTGPAAGGNTVMLVGLGLNGATQVLFGATPATIAGGDPLGFTLNVVAPPGTGTVLVTVVTPSGTTNPVPYTYGTGTGTGVPTAASILPNQGLTTGGTPFVIVGTNLSGGTVTFGATPATVLATTPLAIIGLVPPHAAGNVPVVVTTPGGTATVPGGYTYLAPPPPPPVVTGTVKPNTSPAGGGGTFTISGSNLAGATVTFGFATATIISNTGATITGTIPAGIAGTIVPVLVTTPSGTAFAGILTYLAPPVVTATVSPSTGPAAGTTPFTIGGTDLTGATVTFGGTPATIVSNTGTVITGTTPAGAAGTVPVVVTTGGGSASGGTYTYV